MNWELKLYKRELTDLISAIDVMYYGKVMHFRDDDESGAWYSRIAQTYVSLEDVMDDIYKEIKEILGGKYGADR